MSGANTAAGADRFHKAFLLLLVVIITALFLSVIRPFVLTVMFAAMLTGFTYPMFAWICRAIGGRQRIAALMTIGVVFFGVLIPLTAFLGVVANEARQVGARAQPWFQSQEAHLEEWRDIIERRVPVLHPFVPDAVELGEHIRDGVSRTGTVILGSLAVATRGTLNFLLQLFILLYAIFYFFVSGPKLLRLILYYAPLAPTQEAQLLERFVSVTRATLKGSLLIGVIQGGAAGLAFWVAGVPGPTFWGTVMIVLSIIPVIGASLVWVPTVVYLFLLGQTWAAIGLLTWCVVVVSTIDNVLRPKLIGRDARMSDLLILLSTLGGIFLFGAVGFVIGPIIAALFVTVWHIYGETFRTWLPGVPVGALGSATEPDGGNVAPTGGPPGAAQP